MIQSSLSAELSLDINNVQTKLVPTHSQCCVEPTDKPAEFRPLQNVLYHPDQNLKEKGMP